MGDRCTGHCCKCFPLGIEPDERPTGFSPDELEEIFNAHAEDREPTANGGRYLNDIEIVYPMIRYLGESTVRIDGEKVDPPIHVYECAHLQENGDCGIYESRPEVCRDYPYGRPCGQPDCTWDEAREPEARLPVVA